MEETSVIDTFGLCWKAILTESKQLHCKLNKKSDIKDSRDANFSKTKNRLAFIYKYGCLNIQLVGKCISNFLVECSESENIFPLNNLKVCSLSNGPGLDIIGLLCALYKPQQSWKCLPELKAVNLYDSWLNVYKVMVHGAYDEICLKSCMQCNDVQVIPNILPSENIQLIQNDIYTKISSEAEKFISESNVLLMVNVFVSSKPTADGSFINTLKKILSLLKPGTLIFLVGTKCIKKFLENSSLSDIVKCMFGPRKVTLKNLAFGETFMNSFEQKPLSSGSAHFFVWQKKEMILPVIDKTAVPDPTIDTFNLCWNAILTESKQFNDTLFDKSHFNLIDSRDSNFIKVENRLAYTYKFGYFNTQCIEKCISNFLVEFSESETIFPLENWQICSLSNGPGLDIIGLLCALYISKKQLLCFPQLRAVNLYDSWLNMYKMLVQRSCEALYLKSYYEYFQIPSENIQFIQSDIYTKLSPEAEKFISESNVLLMVNTFVSSKATADTCSNTLKKVFSLLKPGTLIFFVGTKQNKKKISEDASLKNFVKCIFGPKKVTIESLSPNKVVDTLNVKLENSGSVYFHVWQKREIDISLSITGTKKCEALKIVEKQNDEDDSILDELSNVPDAGSETSFTSCSKQSELLYDELKNDSLSNSDLNEEFSDRESQNLSQNSIVNSLNSITSIVDKMGSMLDNIEDSNTGELDFKCAQSNMCHLINESESNNFQEIKFGDSMTSETKSGTPQKIYPLIKAIKKRRRTAKKVKNQKTVEKQNDEDNSILDDLSNVPDVGSETSFSSCSKQSELLSDELKNDSLLNDSDVNEEFGKRELQNLSKNSNDHSLNSITSIANKMGSILNIEDSNTGELNFKCAQPIISHLINESGSKNLGNNIQERKLEKNMTNEIKSKIPKKKSPLNKATKKQKKTAKKVKNQITQVPQAVKEAIKEYISGDKVDLSFSNIESSCTNDVYQNVFPSIIQNEVYKVHKNIPNENKKYIVQANTSSENQSHENISKFARNETDAQTLNDQNGHDIQKLIQRCDSLVTSLEEMTADIKRNINPRNDQPSKCCSVSETCKEISVPHCSGSANTVPSNHYRKVCKCNMIKNACTSSLPCRKYTKEAYECCFGNKKSVNFPRPYIVIPL